MPSLRTTLSRLGASDLADLLGSETASLLEALDERNLSEHRLAELLLNLYGAERTLLDGSLRQRILVALPRGEADSLVGKLGRSPSSDPWTELSEMRYRRNSPACNALFEFFGEESPAEGSGPAFAPAIVEIGPDYPLFSHQRDACMRVLQLLLEEGASRVLLHMPTGSGKTRTAMNAIAHYLRNQLADDEVIVWLAHSEELCEQAAEEFSKAWAILGDRPVKLFRRFGPARAELDSVRGGVLVAGLRLTYEDCVERQSAFARLARRTRMVVMDEAHQAIARTYRHILQFLAANEQRCCILGLSATPGRSWLDVDQDEELARFFNRNKVTLDVAGYGSPVDFLVAEGYLARVDYRPLRYKCDEPLKLSEAEVEEIRAGFDIPRRVVEKLARDQFRNLQILRCIVRAAEVPTNRILVFACSVEHARLLTSLLKAKGCRAEAITSLTPLALRRQAIAGYKEEDDVQILVNYGVLTMGFDAPRTNVAVVARPTRSLVLYSQMVGRAARGPRAGGNATSTVWTVVDNLPGFRSLSEAFGFWEDIWS